MSTRSVSPGPSSIVWIVPPEWTKTSPSPSSFCMMNPSPPNRPTPIFFWNAIPTDTPRAAQTNESFWQISWPPSVRRSSARTFPGYGAAKATRSLRPPRLVKTVMNRLSPVSTRLPALSRAPITPPCCEAAEPSPKIVSISIPEVMYISTPASATTASPGSSATSTYCISAPLMSNSMSCAPRPGSVGTPTGPLGPPPK